MKNFRRIIFFVTMLIVIICTGLLVTNYDPTNPTHRRYSSEPVITDSDNTNLIGLSGEQVLSKDLDIQRNEEHQPRLAICNPKPVSFPKDAECIYYSEEIRNYRIPDFISDDIIADSKNRRVWNKSDIDQITEFAIASKALKRPLWIYVRHNTVVDEVYHDIVESTGGKVVYYFATKGYINPTDFHLLITLSIALGTMVVILVWELLAIAFSFALPTPQLSPSSVVVSPHKTSRKAQTALDNYDSFIKNTGENIRKTLDE